MGAPCASIPGEGVTGPFEARVPCLSPPELGLTLGLPEFGTIWPKSDTSDFGWGEVTLTASERK
jgi:hypothetical protein